MTQGGTETPAKGGRDWGIDVARGFAVLLMIQTHAYDAWVRVLDRGSWAYRITRELGAIPAPIFVMLAGVGVALGEHAMRGKGALSEGVRRRFVKRGLEVLFYAYVVSAVYALMDGAHGVAEFLRADILHAIALSIVVLSIAVVGRRRRNLLCAIAIVITILASIALTRTVRSTATSAPVAAVAALFFDVPPYSRFPLFPTVAFAFLGYAVGAVLATHKLSASRTAVIGALAVVVAILANLATKAWVDAVDDGPLSRMHPALVANYIDGSARAIAVIAIAMLVAARMPAALRRACVRLGQGSLFAYAFHIPFCYGRVGRPLLHSMDMRVATLAVLGLMLLTYLAVLLRDLVRERVVRSRA